jgi:hypothetical protein
VFDSSPEEIWRRLIRRAAVLFAQGGRHGPSQPQPPADHG